MDPTMCRGKDKDGNQCICIRSDARLVDDRMVCKSCDHIDSAHPEPKPAIGSLLRGFRDAGKLGSSSHSIKASKEEAEAETSAGLRSKKRKSETDTEPPSKKPKAKKVRQFPPFSPSSFIHLSLQEKKLSESELVKYGKLVFLPCGLTPVCALVKGPHLFSLFFQSGDMRQSRVPDPETMAAMKKAGLVVLNTPPQNELVMGTAWSSKRANREIKSLVPQAIEYVERRYSPNPNDPPEVQAQLWVACTKKYNNFSLTGEATPTGADLAYHCKLRGASHIERTLYLGV